MDTLSVVSTIAGLLSLATEILLKLRAYERSTLSQSYGGTAGFVISTFFWSTASEYERLQRVVVQGNDDEALRFRASVIKECNMTAVAVSPTRSFGLDPFESSVRGLRFR